MFTSSIPFVNQSTPRALAQALSDYAKGDFGTKVTMRPFNRFQPDDTFWWVCPGTVDPAFHYGKYVTKTVADLEPEHPYLFAGICFEKGVGPTAKDFSHKSSLTGRKWIWHPFIAALSEGGFERPAQAAQDAGRGWGHQPFHFKINAQSRSSQSELKIE